MIRAVFFDYDGVLTTDATGSLTTLRFLCRATGLDATQLRAAFARHNRALTLGRTTHAEVWPQIEQALGHSLDIGLLREAFESTPLNCGMVALARALQPQLRVGIITDNKQDRLDHLTRHQRLDALFDPIVVSAQVGSDKQQPVIFMQALQRAGVRADEAVFIDNHEGNLIAPRALGMHTIFHDHERNDLDALRRALQALGVPVAAP